MRKLFLAVLLAVSVAGSAFAADVKTSSVNTKVKNSFYEEFSDAKNVEWSVKDGYVKATFELDGKKVEAFYQQNGESIGTSTPITLDKLPSSTKRYLGKKYYGYTFYESIQFDTPVETAYFLSGENEKEKVILKVERGTISIVTRSAKG